MPSVSHIIEKKTGQCIEISIQSFQALSKYQAMHSRTVDNRKITTLCVANVENIEDDMFLINNDYTDYRDRLCYNTRLSASSKYNQIAYHNIKIMITMYAYMLSIDPILLANFEIMYAKLLKRFEVVEMVKEEYDSLKLKDVQLSEELDLYI